jgi:hypothetical protein
MLARLQGRIPAGACRTLSLEELWAVQRDAIDAAIALESCGAPLSARIRLWARDFQVSGADDLPAPALWPPVRIIVDAQSGGLELDWSSQRLQEVLAAAAKS